MVQLKAAAMIMAMITTRISERMIRNIPLPPVRPSATIAMSDTKPPIMNTSPWAKLIMPMIP